MKISAFKFDQLLKIPSPPMWGRGLPRLSPQGFRRGRVRGSAVEICTSVTTALNPRHSPSPTTPTVSLRLTKAPYPLPLAGAREFLRVWG
jgi:hypothetical protein